MKFMKADLKVPYHELHLDEAPHKWKQKGMLDEKRIRVVKLVNFDTKPYHMFNKTPEKLDYQAVESDRNIQTCFELFS